MRNIEKMAEIKCKQIYIFSNSAWINIGVDWRKYNQHDYIGGRDDKGSVLINQETFHVNVGIYRIPGMVGKIIYITYVWWEMFSRLRTLLRKQKL